MSDPDAIYAALHRMVFLQGRLDDRAKAWLDELATQLALSADQRAAIAKRVEDELTKVEESGDGPVVVGRLLPRKAAFFDVGEGLSAVAFSPNQRLVAASSYDGDVYVFNIISGERVAVLDGHQDYVNAVAWRDDTSLASVSDDGVAILWDLNNASADRTWQAHRSEASSIAFSPNGALLASGGWDRRLAITDADSGALKHELATADRIHSLAWSPDGAFVATGALATVQLWDAESGSERQRVDSHDDLVHAVAFSPDGALLASGADDGRVVLWDLVKGVRAHLLEGHREGVKALAFGAQGRLLVSGGDDDTLRLWDVATGEALHQLEVGTGVVYGAAATRDGRLAATAGDGGDGPFGGKEGVQIWRLL